VQNHDKTGKQGHDRGRISAKIYFPEEMISFDDFFWFFPPPERLFAMMPDKPPGKYMN